MFGQQFLGSRAPYPSIQWHFFPVGVACHRLGMCFADLFDWIVSKSETEMETSENSSWNGLTLNGLRVVHNPLILHLFQLFSTSKLFDVSMLSKFSWLVNVIIKGSFDGNENFFGYAVIWNNADSEEIRVLKWKVDHLSLSLYSWHYLISRQTKMWIKRWKLTGISCPMHSSTVQTQITWVSLFALGEAS